MILTPSTPDPDGHVVIAEYDDDTRVTAQFTDGSDPVDLTGRMADLVLLGMHANARRRQGVDGAPAETVEVAAISCQGTAPVFTYAHPASGEAVRFGWDHADDLLSLAVAEMITAGVASDVADEELAGLDTVPADLEGTSLDDAGPGADGPAPWDDDYQEPPSDDG